MSLIVWRVMSNTRSILSLVAVSLLLLVPSDISAQGVGSTRGLPSSGGGFHTIKGRVYFPDARPADPARCRAAPMGSQSYGRKTVFGRTLPPRLGKRIAP